MDKWRGYNLFRLEIHRFRKFFLPTKRSPGAREEPRSRFFPNIALLRRAGTMACPFRSSSLAPPTPASARCRVSQLPTKLKLSVCFPLFSSPLEAPLAPVVLWFFPFSYCLLSWWILSRGGSLRTSRNVCVLRELLARSPGLTKRTLGLGSLAPPARCSWKRWCIFIFICSLFGCFWMVF